MFKGENLLELQASHEPSKFGWELARKIFAEKNNCKQEKMLGPGRRMFDQRGRVDEHVETIFNGICFFLIWKKWSENSQESKLKNWESFKLNFFGLMKLDEIIFRVFCIRRCSPYVPAKCWAGT